MSEKKAWTLSVLVEDTPGVMSQVARLFSRKGYNIESIAAGPADRPGETRISVVTIGDEKMINQIATQLSKLLLVISVDILTSENSIQRELALIKVSAETRDQRDAVLQIINVFRASVLDMGRESMTVAVLGDAEKIKAILNLLDDFGILEVVRSGMIALQRGHGTIYDRTRIKEEYNYGKNVL